MKLMKWKKKISCYVGEWFKNNEIYNNFKREAKMFKFVCQKEKLFFKELSKIDLYGNKSEELKLKSNWMTG